MQKRCKYCVAANRPCDRRHLRGRTLLVTVYPFKMGLTTKPRKPGFFRFSGPLNGIGENFHLKIARLLSQAPRSLSRSQAEELLRKNHGSVRRAAREARRMAFNDPKVAQPVPEVDIDKPFNYKNLGHALNSCYIASTITACFSCWDAWDALLVAPSGTNNKNTEALRNTLRNVVNGIRLGNTVSRDDVDKLRRAMTPHGFPSGHQQEDATHFFSVLVESLGAPLVPLHEELVHKGDRDENDERLIAERFIWLAFSDGGSQETNLETLLTSAFFGEIREGLRRQSRTGQDVVDAWCHRLLLPEYTPSTPAQLGYTRNSFDTLTLPLALKRYGNGMRKIRTSVQLPLTFDFNDFVKPPGSHLNYTLQLKSVVCHLGSRLGFGHYVSYTHDANGWRRWDDMGPANVELGAEAVDGLPQNRTWRDEILRDSYMVFYELVPGDGSLHLAEVLDAKMSQDLMECVPKLVNELVTACSSDEMIARFEQARADAEYARRLQSGAVMDFSSSNQMENDEEQTSIITEEDNLEIARAIQKEESQLLSYNQMKADENLARTMEEEENLAAARTIQRQDMAQLAHSNQVKTDEELARSMEEEENVRVARNVQMMADEEYARNLEKDESERVARKVQMKDDERYAEELNQAQKDREKSNGRQESKRNNER